MHTVGHRVMEEDWKFLGWFEHSKTILYFAGSTQPLCLSHVTLAMTPLPLSALLPPNFCFSFPGILLFFSPGLQPPCQELVRQSGSDYPLCLVLNIPRASYITHSPHGCSEEPSWSSTKSSNIEGPGAPAELNSLWGMFQTQVGQEVGRNNLDCPWWTCHHCQCLGMMLDKQHSVPLQAHNKILKHF